MSSPSLSCSIVIYRPAEDRFQKTVRSVAAAARYAGLDGRFHLLIVNNERHATRDETIRLLRPATAELGAVNLEVIAGHGNVGYGRGHNLAAARSNSDYHLVLNPDITLGEDALARALEFMENNPRCGLLAAKARDGSGMVQHLCKRYPTVADLILRGFMPLSIRRRFRGRLDRYEMRDVIADRVVWDVPIVSGCFMLFRRQVLAQLGGFSPKYFLYFEDFDISLRARQITRVAYVPQVEIVHFGGQAARKGVRHIGMFVRSAVTFFNQHGWKYW